MIFIIFSEFMLFYQISLSQKVKQSAVVSNKHGLLELPHNLPKDLRLNISGK